MEPFHQEQRHPPPHLHPQAQEQPRFGLLRSIFNTISGSLSSLVANHNPFRWKRRRICDSEAEPLQFRNHGHSSSPPDRESIALFPEPEYAESRKRARLMSPETLTSKNSLNFQGENHHSDGFHHSKGSFLHCNNDGFEQHTPPEVSIIGSGGEASYDVHEPPTQETPPAGPDTPVSEAFDTPISDNETLDGFMGRLTAGKRTHSTSENASSLSKKRLKTGKFPASPALESSSETLHSRSSHFSRMETETVTPQRMETDTVTQRKRKSLGMADVQQEKKIKAIPLLIPKEEVVEEAAPVETEGMGQFNVDDTRNEIAENGPHKDVVDTEMGTVGDEKLKRIIVIHSLPALAKRDDLIKEFSQYGALEIVQLGHASTLNSKVLGKRTMKDRIDDSSNSQSALIVYKEELSANAALANNIKQFNGSRIYVEPASKEALSGSFDQSRSIILSNLPAEVEDEEIVDVFSGRKTLKAEVQALRIFRDSYSKASTGKAFVVFKTEAIANRVLSLKRNLKMKGKVLEVSRVSLKPRVTFAVPTEQKPHATSSVDRRSIQRPTKRAREATDVDETVSQKKRGAPESSESSKKSEPQAKKSQKSVSMNSSSSDVTKENSNRSKNAVKQENSNEDETNSERLPGEKQKREEKRQRGISRSKKIRRS